MSEPAGRARVLFEIGARRRTSPAVWAARHAQSALFALGLLARAPLGTALTCAVLGIALALPATLYLALDNARRAGGGWESAARVSVFLAPEVDDQAARALGAELERRADVDSVRVVTRAQALEEYKALSGFGEVVEAFGNENPLPAVLELIPPEAAAGAGDLARLAAELERRPEVDLALVDLEWVRRLGAILDLLRRAVAAGAILLAVGVVLIVGNTIRLGIDNRRDEIAISRLFGATDAFIRRPFLYSGLWYGLAGGAIAWLLVAAVGLALAGPVERIALLYGSEFRLADLGPAGALALVAGGAALGLAGSWLAVARHLASADPV